MNEQNWEQEELNKAINDCKAKAMTDIEFRRQLIAEPEKTIARVAGKELPEGTKIQVLEADPNYTMSIVLPPLLDRNPVDEEFEKICAAGNNFTPKLPDSNSRNGKK